MIECPVHGRIMVPATRIRALHNNSYDGILLEIECWCGTMVAVRTGHRRDQLHVAA